MMQNDQPAQLEQAPLLSLAGVAGYGDQCVVGDPELEHSGELWIGHRNTVEVLLGHPIRVRARPQWGIRFERNRAATLGERSDKPPNRLVMREVPACKELTRPLPQQTMLDRGTQCSATAPDQLSC